MKTIRDVMCISTPYGEAYTDVELNGTVIVENEKAIGILKKDDYIYLTFGTITDHSTELIVSSDFDKELPKLYEGSFIGRSYYGDKSVVNRYDKIPIEECRITVFNPEIYRSVDDDEIEQVEKAVEVRKKLLGEESTHLYEQYFDSNKTKNYML